MSADAGTIAATALRPTAARATDMQDMSKGAGSHFRTFRTALDAFEKKGDRTPDDIRSLRAAADGYLAHAKSYSQKESADPRNVKKVAACNNTLAELDKLDRIGAVEAEVASLGPPPWMSDVAMKAASLRATLDFEGLPAQSRRARRLDGGGKNQAFWIDRKSGANTTQSFIFKPANPVDAPGFVDGGEPTREAMAGRVADMLNETMGLRIPMPETQVVSLATSNFPADDLFGPQQRRPEITGSLQKFAPTTGELRGESRAARDQVSAGQCQAMAVLDTITLNTDRHGGNFLVRPGAAGAPELVPIDHGMTFPTRGSADHVVRHLGTPHNALLALPGAHQPFDAGTLNSLASLDPDALAVALKRERDAMATARPETVNTMSDESIDLARRSAMFLKRAAPTLTPAAVQVAISRHQLELFDPALTDANFPAVADAIIQQTAAEQSDLAEYFLMSPQQQDRMKDKLQAAGWDVGQEQFTRDSILLNPALALKIYKSGAVLPSEPMARPLDMGDPGQDAELAAARAAFPSVPAATTLDEKQRLLTAWRAWRALGGSVSSVREAAAKLGTRQGLTALDGDLIQSVEILKAAARIDAAIARTRPVADPLKRSVELKLDLAGEVAANLAPPIRAREVAALAGLRAALGTINGTTPEGKRALAQRSREAEGAIDRITTAVQQRLVAKAAIIATTPLARPGLPAIDAANARTLADRAASGDTVGFFELIGQINDVNWNAVMTAP